MKDRKNTKNQRKKQTNKETKKQKGRKKEQEESHRQLCPLRGSSSSFGAWSQQGLKPIKLVYDVDQPNGRLDLTDSAFKPTGSVYQHSSSLGGRAYCYAELVAFFLAVTVTVAGSHCAYPRRDGQAESACEAGYVAR